MSPDQQNQNPGTQPQSQPPQQSANGQYPVVPALPSIPNDGHSGHNPYEFIFADTKPKKSSWGGNSFMLRIGVIVGLAAVLITIAAIVLNALAPAGSTPGLTSMASRQQEILRITTAATKKATSQSTLNFIANVDATIASDQRATTSYLTAHGTKLDKITLAKDYDTTADDILATAASTNTYDTAVVENLIEQLEAYRTLAGNTYRQSQNKQAKILLQTAYGNATKLLEQSEPLQTK